ncbi:uncharacterized protein MEPE_00467 [Melanopsichium pennsylvanicum]|uniref:HCNGP-domain-containing protein n=1 Tax=Melanopsichium pennsylvanicum TaxID=63383 RepID=A0AAJ4XGN9_9BASI|nr:uncharacterized protein MEPE_00467 [Melanopsichium pennsylvanicum]
MRLGRDVDCESDNSQTTYDIRSEDRRASHHSETKSVSRTAVVTSFVDLKSPSATPDSVHNMPEEAGRSRPRHSHCMHKNAEAEPLRTICKASTSILPENNTISDSIKSDFANHSRFSPSILPRANIRDSTELVTDYFTGEALGEIDDPDLFPLLPLLGPPRQPLPSKDTSGGFRENKAYWGISTETKQFFSKHDHHFDLDQSPQAGKMSLNEVDPKIHANVERFHKLKAEGVHFNQVLMANRSFRNPHVYSQLVDFLDIDETRSNFSCVDIGRAKEGWRKVFPLSEEALMDGDPIRILEKQQQEYQDQQKQKWRAGHKRKINFSPARFTQNKSNEQHDDNVKTRRKETKVDTFATGNLPEGESSKRLSSRFVDRSETYDSDADASRYEGKHRTTTWSNGTD